MSNIKSWASIVRAGGLAVLLATALAACSNENSIDVANNQAYSTFTMPEQLRNLRALVNPMVEVSINDVNVPVTQQTDSDTWVGETMVDLNQQHHVQILWSDELDGGSIELVRAEEWFSTPTTEPFNITFDNSQFDSSSDLDGDGRSNLQELQNDTNPNDPNSPPEELDMVSFGIEVPKPDELVQANISDNSLFVRATLNNGPFRLGVQDGAIWAGNDEVAADMPAFLTVEWCYRLSSGRSYRLLRFARSVEIGSENRTLTSADVSYRSDYDLDADGISNIQEIVNGTQPASSGLSTACQ